MDRVAVATWSDLPPLTPTGARVANVDLVIVRYERSGVDQVSVLYGRCLHRGALLADGSIVGHNLVCGLHNWDYRYDTGVSEYNNDEFLHKFGAWIEDVAGVRSVTVDADEVRAWAVEHPQPFDRDAYLGDYQDPHGTVDEPHNSFIQRLAREGIEGVGHHGPTLAMGVPHHQLPKWDELQIVTAQLRRKPLLDDHAVDTRTVIGPAAARPLVLDRPLFVSDMSFGAISEEAKLALAKGAERAGTGICSGEGGMLPEEQQANARYLLELASGRFGWSIDNAKKAQAMHFKAGQGAKTGTGGHLPGHKVDARIAQVRGIPVGQSAISPATFPDLATPEDFRSIADEVRAATGGIPVGFKMSAQHVEDDLDFALEATADYVILDGRGGGTGAAPALFRNHISVPTIPALARARRHLDRVGRGRGSERPVTLIVTGGLRVPEDFVKALMLGADAIAVSNAALQAIGCLGMRACNTNNCPVGIATRQEHLRARLVVEASAKRLENFFVGATELMKVLARACGHASFTEFHVSDLVTFDERLAALAGVRFAGVGRIG